MAKARVKRAGRLDYNTGEFELTWANDEVQEGSEISVSIPILI